MDFSKDFEMYGARKYDSFINCWRVFYKDFEGGETLHLTAYPEIKSEYDTDVSQMDVALEILKKILLFLKNVLKY